MAITLVSLQLSAFISTTVIIISIYSLLKILKWLYDFGNNCDGRILLILGIVATINNIITHVWLAMLGNNSLFTFINEKYPFIDNHCLSFIKMLAMMYPIYMSTLQIFILMRMYHILKILPKKYRGLGPLSYRLINIVILIINFLIFWAFREGTNDSFKIEMFIAINNNKYKQCNMSVFNPPKIWGMQIFIPLCLVQISIHLYVQFICSIKLYQFNKYSNNGYIYNDFNMPYLHKNLKHIKIMLYLPIINFILSIICVVIDIYSQHQLYQLTRIIDTFVIVFFIHQYFNDKILNNNNNLALQLIDDSYDNYNSHKINMMRFNIDKPFIKQANILFGVLREIFEIESIAKVIAEYASTMYLKCIKCEILLPFIETYKDWKRQNGSIAYIDEHNNIRYYINTVTSSWSQCMGQREYDYDEDIQVLCIECAKTYMETVTVPYETPLECTLLFFPPFMRESRF